MKRAVILFSLAAFATGCAGKGSRFAAAPAGRAGASDASSAEAAPASEPSTTLAAYESQLRGYEDALQNEGVALADTRAVGGEDTGGAEAQAAPAPSKSEPRDADKRRAKTRTGAAAPRYAQERTDGGRTKNRCERICDIAEATCELADRICALADQHVGEPKYAATCQRAETDCEAATNACQRCAP